MKTPTSSAPHIWRKVSRKTWPSTENLGRIKINMISQETQMDVPPMNGVNENETFVDLPLMEETARTLVLNQLIFGKGDQGPVQSTTTMIRIKKGRKAAQIECWAEGAAMRVPDSPVSAPSAVCSSEPIVAAVRVSCSCVLSSTPPRSEE